MTEKRKQSINTLPLMVMVVTLAATIAAAVVVVGIAIFRS